MSWNERISLAFIFRKNLWHPLSLALMKVFGFVCVLSSYRRCMYYSLGVCMRVAQARALTRVVMSTGTRWYHFSRQNVCRWLEESCFVCVCSRDFFSAPLGVWGPEFFILLPHQVQEVQGFGFCPLASPLRFVVQDLLHRSVFFELWAGCYWHNNTVLTACMCLCVCVCVCVCVCQLEFQHWSLKKHTLTHG